MNYELIYDAVTTSQAPNTALIIASGALGIAVLWGGWLKSRGQPLHVGVKFWIVAAGIMVALSALYRYEQYRIAHRTDVKTVEGPVIGYWTKQERRRNADDSYSTYDWEGFSISGVPFVYRRYIEQNYFHNSGPKAIGLKDGMYLRLRYTPDDNQIVRVEKGVLP